MTPDEPEESERDPVELACELNDAAVEAYGEGRADEAVELFRRASKT